MIHVFNNFSATAAQVKNANTWIPCDVLNFDLPRIMKDMVITATRNLKLPYAGGPDGIPSSILKHCTANLCIPLSKLFSLFAQQCEFPAHWHVVSYREITSLSACSKHFEIIIIGVLFASCKYCIEPEQHGFYPKRSVSTNMVQFASFCLRCMDSGWQVDALYMDLMAAFDTVDHKILLAKLMKLGVSTTSVTWLIVSDEPFCSA